MESMDATEAPEGVDSVGGEDAARSETRPGPGAEAEGGEGAFVPPALPTLLTLLPGGPGAPGVPRKDLGKRGDAACEAADRCPAGPATPPSRRRASTWWQEADEPGGSPRVERRVWRSATAPPRRGDYSSEGAPPPEGDGWLPPPAAAESPDRGCRGGTWASEAAPPAWRPTAAAAAGSPGIRRCASLPELPEHAALTSARGTSLPEPLELLFESPTRWSSELPSSPERQSTLKLSRSGSKLSLADVLVTEGRRRSSSVSHLSYSDEEPVDQLELASEASSRSPSKQSPHGRTSSRLRRPLWDTLGSAEELDEGHIASRRRELAASMRRVEEAADGKCTTIAMWALTLALAAAVAVSVVGILRLSQDKLHHKTLTTNKQITTANKQIKQTNK